MATALVHPKDVVCGRCATNYSTWGSDLSFRYGTFLGVSPSGEVVILDSLSDDTFDEIHEIVRSNSSHAGLDQRQQITLLHEVLSHAYDPDSTGASFRFTGAPGCPACGSTSTSSWTLRQDEAGWIADTPASHHRWDDLSGSDRVDRIAEAIALVLTTWHRDEPS